MNIKQLIKSRHFWHGFTTTFLFMAALVLCIWSFIMVFVSRNPLWISTFMLNIVSLYIMGPIFFKMTRE